ncbi:helix-turn-helix domain-containing protein [Chryseobacterium cheonjiense]|nr:helix-turn-helix domain-containing protein [Chryseobacterium cheonjiense]
MQKKDNVILFNAMDEADSNGISIERISFKENGFPHSHRDEGYTFHILEKGTVDIEIDFNKYSISSPSVVYIHPTQVHRILHFENITICSLSVKDESLNPDYLKLLEQITPVKPLKLEDTANAVLTNICDLCLSFSVKKNDALQHSLLKDSCNMLVAFMIRQFLGKEKPEAHLSRPEIITKSFRLLLEKNYRINKRPGEYADQLHISTAYLNECIKNITGLPVSRHIQERIILEAKRYLYHTRKSVKEISFELGYDDHTYFSKLFKKITGMSALSFRRKNHD